MRQLLWLIFLVPGWVLGQAAFKGTALPATVNTPYDELVPRLSPDDQTLYFVRFQHPGNQGGRAGGQDIWYSNYVEGKGWSAAQNAGAVLNNTHHNFVGGVVQNGNGLVIGNTYAADPAAVKPGFSLSKRVGDVWGAPVAMPIGDFLPEKNRYLDFYCTPDMKVLVMSKMAASGLHEDLFVCFRQGEMGWSVPKSLGDIVNSEGYETGPYLSGDTKRLFFTSNGHGGEGDADIFMTERLDDSWINWTDPVNLGPEVNTPGFDGHLILDSREEKAYFVSGPNATALGDIYEIPVKAIPILNRLENDTLRIFALAGVPVDLDLEPYGVNAGNATFISIRHTEGTGTVKKVNGQPRFVYQPDAKFQGVEHHEFEICDPPQSDNCHKVVLEATVTDPNQAIVKRFELRTPKNKSVDFNYMVDGLSLPETKRNYRLQPGSKGDIVVPDGSAAIFVYRPAKDFVGRDSVPVYGVCPNGETSNCLRAVVYVEVFEELPVVVAVVDTPKVVVAVVDTPKVVVAVVDTPKVVVAVVDTPKVIVTVVDTPKVVVAVVDTPKVVAAVVDVVVSGIVTDEKTGKPLVAELVFYDQGKEVKKVTSDANGAYRVVLPSGKVYALEASQQPYYFPKSATVSTQGKVVLKGQVTQDIALTPVPLEAGQSFVLKNIYFDLDKSILKPESKDELTKLYDLLRNYPTMEIEIKGHTDSQASDEYNQQLSESRAFAVLNYLKYKGVMGYRLRSKGLGEKEPIAGNETEEGRALNRRVEFVILRM